MLMFRKYNPRFATESEIEVQRYAKRLVWPGRVVSLLLALLLTQWVAMILSILMGLFVYAVGGKMRKHEKALAAETSFWRRLWLMKNGATFLLVAVVAVGVSLGQTQWLGKMHAIHEIVHSATIFMMMTKALFP